MICHPWKERKLTPNQWAKLMLIDMGRRAFDCDCDHFGLEHATDRERRECAIALGKVHDRLYNYLGLEKIE